MTALLLTEIRRMTSRRLFRVAAALAILGIALACTIVAIKSTSAPGLGGDRHFHLTSLAATFEGTSVILIIGSWLLGASFIGADWHAGTITTQLTWEPRRVRVMTAKLAGCLATVFLLAVVLQLMLGAGLALAAALRGTTEGVDAAWVQRTSGIALRVAALAAIGSAIGFAIASFARNTAAALGVGFGYTFVVENLVRGLRPQWERWLMGDNAVVFITGQTAGMPFQRTILEAGLLLGAYTAVLLIVGVAVFRTRDVN
jgi:ABC-2 type transport system permease protein